MSKSIQDIQTEMATGLEWKEFEHFVADLWELQGYSTEVTGHHDREGEDIIANQKIPFKMKIFIQTKRRKKEATVKKRVAQIHSLDDGADADLSVIVTTCSFTRGAINFANLRKSTKLVDGESLAKLVKKLNAEELLDDYLKTNSPKQPNVEQYKSWTKDSGGLRDIKGIGEKYAKQLAEADIHTVADLAKINPEDIADETNISERRLQRWIAEAAYQEGEIDVVKRHVSQNEVQAITGIGSARADKLKKAGIETVVDLAVANHREIAQETDFSESTIKKWAQKARYHP